MGYNVGDFGTKIALWANQTKRDMTRYIQETCRGLAEEIITTAPCDTGAYIGNWTPSVGVAITSNDFVPGPSKYTDGIDMSAQNRIRATAHVRRKLDSIIPLISATNNFYFSNGVRHARYVEYGGGRTPPYAIVRLAVQKFRRRLETGKTFGSGSGSNVARSFKSFSKKI